MKIAFVAQPHDRFPPGTGSLSIWATELSTRLSSRHDVSIYCSRPSGSEPREDHVEKVRIARVTSTRIDARAVKLVKFLQRVVGKFSRGGEHGHGQEFFYKYYYFASYYFLWYITQVARAIRRDQADLIILCNVSQFAPVIRFFNPQAKVLLMMECDWLAEISRSKLESRLKCLDAVCGCSDYITKRIADRFPDLADRCFTLHNGCNVDRFCTELEHQESPESIRDRLGIAGKKIILFAGRVGSEKGVHVLLDAMRRVLQENPDTALLILGDRSSQPPSPRWLERKDPDFDKFEKHRGNYWAHCQELAEPCADRIFFLGSIPHHQLPTYYGLADVFVHPAVWNEPFGMVLTEAMGCGLPVVSTQVGGIPEIVVDGETGLLVQPGDSDELGAAICKLLSSDELRQNMGRRGWERVRSRFTWESTSSTLESVIGRLAIAT